MDYKKIEAISNGEWVLTEVKKEYGNYPGFHRNLPPGSLCTTFRVDVPPFSLAETEEELLAKLQSAEEELLEKPLQGIGDAIESDLFWEKAPVLPYYLRLRLGGIFQNEEIPFGNSAILRVVSQYS